MALSLGNVRALASSLNYTEVDLNDTSKVVSFHSADKKTKINIYYTTGTVGTCLNHPKRGKTQLFRRNYQDLSGIAIILSNPRAHTGEGYYTRKNISQYWKNGNDSICDSARRWAWVGPASGLVQNHEEAMAIQEICTKWDKLYWEPDAPPNARGTRFACGSHEGLLKMLYEVFGERVGEFQVCNHHDCQKFLDGEITMDEVENDLPFSEDCDNEVAFLKYHIQDVLLLKSILLELRKEILIEFAQWIIGRDEVGRRFTDMNYHVITTPYSGILRETHDEYGMLMYPKKSDLCNHCGVFCNSKPVVSKIVGFLPEQAT
eukprot:CAMPEP_0172446630 /NCGR_PEP_ID=MMETSP1065-20121228/6189_1 /TAXON_ID=265537 /ORGANISM="Amphiprora paludosa, Strain CCMP125" /LENGTH=317 /DNA_ID=CAMNT_0013197795 /DNA_START=48 /DNA_END=1001 /DNA_ORIENTATION=-